MPHTKVPVELCSYSEDWSAEENYKADSVSSRSSSPKSLTESWASSPISISEASESPEGSVISDSETEADRIANDLDNMKITEIQAEEMMKEGADMRHVLKAAYMLKPKCLGKIKFKKGMKLNGRAVLGLLNFDSYQEKEEDYAQAQRMSRAWSEYEQKQTRGRGGRPPPGFENLDQAIAKQFNSKLEEPEFLVSYANGTNTLSLATEPIVVHDVTVSCVVDSCRVFIQHMKNPTFEGLCHLEEELYSTYEMEPPKPLLRPIAMGSVLGVFSDSKWYRCQVVSYNAKQDTCDVKFVDHGGYTTVPADNLRQLKPDFLRLPFQAIEVYLANVNPSQEEIQTDIASEILFHGNVSMKLLGRADDGLPMIQAYYYDGDYINVFSQQIVDSCTPACTPENMTPSTESPCSSEALSEAEYPSLPESPEASLPVTPESYEPVTYPYYCPTDYYPAVIDPSQTPVAYIYQDAEGNQQIYYVLPAVPLPVPSEEPSEDASKLTFGWTDPEASPVPEQQTEEEELENKPTEEWTQEDYARYYGM
jgi:hypothetical protein